MTLALHPPQNFGASPNFWPEILTSRKPHRRHGQTMILPTPHVAITQTCSGMQAKLSYGVGSSHLPLCTKERSSPNSVKPVTACNIPKHSYHIAKPPRIANYGAKPKQIFICGRMLKNAYLNPTLIYSTISLGT